MSKKLKKKLYKILTGAGCYVACLLLEHFMPKLNNNLLLIAFLIAYYVIGADVIKKAAHNISIGQIFDENFLMLVATVGAFCVGDYPEAVAVMLFYQVGEWFQDFAVNRSRKSIAALMDIRPDYANVLRDGEICEVEPDEVSIGEVIVIKPGEKVPLDGKVIKGTTTLDTRALTGESIPQNIEPDDMVMSGCINLSGVIEVETTKEFGESTVSKILELVENASEKKSESENFISKFAKYYTPTVVILAALLAVIPPVILGGGWKEWIYRALSFLVISCPCALVISIPLSFFGGIGGASKAGILVNGSNYLEAIAKADIVAMDKTGTLTKGNFAVTSVIAEESFTKEELLELSAYGEYYSNHPIAESLKTAYGKEIDEKRIKAVNEKAGFGILADMDKGSVLVGNEKLMKESGVIYNPVEEIGTVVYVALDGKFAGAIVITDELKEDARACVDGLHKAGIKKLVMLTGDHNAVAENIAKKLSVDAYEAELLPKDKVDKIEALFQEKSEKGKLVFVGDGINDAPVLARADIGIAMGGLGSDAAIEAADIVIMTDAPSKIVQAIQISKKTLAIVKQNIVFAIGVKVLVLLLAAIGRASMWAAVFADVGVAVIAIVNAMRAMKVKEDIA